MTPSLGDFNKIGRSKPFTFVTTQDDEAVSGDASLGGPDYTEVELVYDADEYREAYEMLMKHDRCH